jgi:hypothetical protein
MPPRTMPKGKAVRVKKVSGRATRGAAKKAPAKLTYKDMQRFLQFVKKSWTQLDGNVNAVTEMIRKLPVGQPLPPDVARKFRNLVKRIERQLQCPYPQHVQNICV